MAGLYAMVDRTRGVWKAPANVTLNYVNSPAENIDDEQQEGLNAPMNGKAVNVIRTFRGEGVKVWGGHARWTAIRWISGISTCAAPCCSSKSR